MHNDGCVCVCGGGGGGGGRGSYAASGPQAIRSVTPIDLHYGLQ